MSNDWQAAYDELKEYVTGNPKINVSRDIVAIPEDLRPEFYRILTAVRMTFIENKFSSFICESQTLSNKYVGVRDKVVKLLGLDKISEVELNAPFGLITTRNESSGTVLNGWGRRIRTFPYGSRVRCPTTRRFPSRAKL